MGNMVNLVCVDRNSACTCAKREGFGEKSNQATDKKIVFYAADYYCKQRVKSRKKRKKNKN